MTFVFITALLAALPTANPFGLGVAEKPAIPSNKIESTINDPEVFKRLNLNFPNPDQKGNLIVDINRGFVEVTGHEQSGVVIEVLKPKRFLNSREHDDQLVEFFAPKYDLKKDPKKNSIKLDTYNQDFVLNLRIKVPLATDLSLDTYTDGYLKVKNVNGNIETRTQHCDIRLLDIEGSASGYSRNGNLTIEFNKVAPTAVLDFESYNGKIDLTLPASISATTAIASGRGSYRSGFDVASIKDEVLLQAIQSKIKRNVDEYQFGMINGGGISLRIESENGLIQIRKKGSLGP